MIHIVSSRVLRLLGLALLVASSAASVLAQQPVRNTVASAGVDTPGKAPIVVSGTVPDEASRQLILGRVREIYGAARVVDQLGVAPSSAPPLWAEQVKKMLTADLRGVQRGHLRVSGNTVELVGQIDNAAAKEKIAAGLTTSLNSTYTVDNQLQVAAAPQARIDSVLAGKIVEFEFGSSVLTDTGRQVLDAVLPVLQSVSDRKVQVLGHTDGVGARASNMALSQARANAVKVYLVSKGLPAAELQVAGMGPDQPIASNATAEGQAKNRRIEFKILP